MSCHAMGLLFLTFEVAVKDANPKAVGLMVVHRAHAAGGRIERAQEMHREKIIGLLLCQISNSHYLDSLLQVLGSTCVIM